MLRGIPRLIAACGALIATPVVAEDFKEIGCGGAWRKTELHPSW